MFWSANPSVTFWSPSSFLPVCGYICTIGNDVTTCSAGYLSVGVTLGVGSISGSIMEWMPTMIELAVVGMVAGMMKKFGR